MLAHADWQEEEGKPEAATRSYSVSSEGHAADKAALQGFAKTRDAASSPAQPSKVLALPCPALILRHFASFMHDAQFPPLRASLQFGHMLKLCTSGNFRLTWCQLRNSIALAFKSSSA